MGRLKELEIPLPPLAEQKSIAGILDAADALRAKRREALAQLDTLLQSAFLDMFGDPVTNPMGWEAGVIRDLLASANYGTSKKADLREGEYPILRMNNITYSGEWDFSSLKYIDLAEEDLPKHLVHKGQILFNRTNSKELVGKTEKKKELSEEEKKKALQEELSGKVEDKAPEKSRSDQIREELEAKEKAEGSKAKDSKKEETKSEEKPKEQEPKADKEKPAKKESEKK